MKRKPTKKMSKTHDLSVIKEYYATLEEKKNPRFIRGIFLVGERYKPITAAINGYRLGLEIAQEELRKIYKIERLDN